MGDAHVPCTYRVFLYAQGSVDEMQLLYLFAFVGLGHGRTHRRSSDQFFKAVFKWK